MERLTKVYPSGGWGITGELDDAILRLAAYEETGLEPEDIKQTFTEETALKLAGQALGVSSDRLRELAQADREGRCVVLPAKTVFELTWDAGPECDGVCPVCIDGEDSVTSATMGSYLFTNVRVSKNISNGSGKMSFSPALRPRPH